MWGLLTTEDDVESLEKVLEDGDIAGEEDEGEDRGKGDGGDTGVLPAEEVVEERVVVSQGLASGSGLVRHSLGVHQVGVLLRRLLALNSGLLGCGAVGEVLVSSAGIWNKGELEL
jgi:hypothetical protein